MSSPEPEGIDAFRHLHPEVRETLSERGFQTPTAPQREAIPPIVSGENALVIAPTGTGKTESAMLPVFSQILEAGPEFGISALLVTPLRSLNRDMRSRLEWWGEVLGLDVQVRHGDTTQYQRGKQADNPPDVLITTPETIQAMLTGSKLRRGMEDINHIIVDEIHELVGAKRGAQLTIALERLQALAGDFQRVGLSATVGSPATVGEFLTGGRGCTVIDCGQMARIDIEVLYPDITDRDEELAQELATDVEIATHVRVMDEIIEANESTLIFVNTRTTAEALGSRFKELGTNLGVHHGSLAKESRISVEESFKEGELDALLCTSSMELGIDVGRIDHVIQYQSPRQVRRLLQRIGRAGHRRDEVSRGTIITSNTDDAVESMVIARKAARGDVESARIHYGSLDTVANQVVGLVMGHGEIPAMRAYDIITGAYPFQAIGEAEFKEIVDELASNRIVYLDREEDSIQKTNGSWQYFYSNLSMIPDEAKYTVKDIASGREIGTLDERFVIDFAEPGEIFIQRGEMWRITEVDREETEIQVSPVEDPTAEAPSWTGQEIPVPYDVAQSVGDTRNRVVERVAGDGDTHDLEQELHEEFPSSPASIRNALDQFEAHDEVVPTDDRILVEFSGREICVNACFGHKINETLGRLLSALLGQQTGSSIALETDPYRISLEVPRGITGGDVADVLTDTDPDHVEAILELTLKQTDALRFKLAQVATKFGRLKEWKDSGQRQFSNRRLLAALEETPAFDEAIREFMHEELSIEEAVEVLERIQADEISIAVVGTRTPIGQGGRSAGGEILSPDDADASVIQTVRDRIQEDRIRLFCVHCQEWERTKPIKRVREQPRCPNCESTMIAALNPWAEEVVRSVKQADKDDSEEKDTRKAYRTASLVQSHGKKAVIALAGRGVGPENAARIINNHRESEDEFYRDILRREREYARTKAFWD
jgi:ATP-dependent Lhr-like helicase